MQAYINQHKQTNKRNLNTHLLLCSEATPENTRTQSQGTSKTHK